eukprot:TRINITY_DN32988_c0_g1_i1.p2 TRINITY_DN32988_c0_g1~~TRINITY_DN32988_c0_g1_i1.p2  ORF type:complete len:401 (-),score=73.86 TRINITY_DN32988_c0_g1_i1:8-1210(-)
MVTSTMRKRPAAARPTVRLPASAAKKRPASAASLADRAKTALQRHVAHSHRTTGGALKGGNSLLENIVPSEATEKMYIDLVTKFNAWLVTHQLAPMDAANVVTCFLDYLDTLFLEGFPYAEGSKTWAALQHLVPELRLLAAGLKERVHRALKGWAKTSPAGARLPPSENHVLAIVLDLLWDAKVAGDQKYFNVAVAAFLQYLSYNRPSEHLNITAQCVIPPVESTLKHHQFWALILNPKTGEGSKPGKTGERDESVLLDHPIWTWAGRLLQPLLRKALKKDENTLIFDISYAEYAHFIKIASEHIQRAGERVPHVEPYSFRHAGASNDLLGKIRTLEQVKARGRWRSDSSVARYGKAARAQQQAHLLPATVLDFVIAMRPKLENIMLKRLEALPRPPWRQ